MTTDLGTQHRVRVMVFVDFWNFQLLVNRLFSDFRVDWRVLGQALAQEASQVVDAQAALSYQGMNVYLSYDPSSEKDLRLQGWASNTLNEFPGVQATLLERQRKRRGPACPSCHREVSVCPHCGADMRGTEEKGVDTRIATDMIKLAWADSYDVAVLLSSDRDFVPVVEFLTSKGIKTIHAALPRQGDLLTKTCWGNIQVAQMMEKFRRTRES